MNESADATTAAEFAKDLALGVTKEVVITAAGYATAFVMLGAIGQIVIKVRNRKAAENKENPEN